jgi:hypothetical protein
LIPGSSGLYWDPHPARIFVQSYALRFPDIPHSEFRNSHLKEPPSLLACLRVFREFVPRTFVHSYSRTLSFNVSARGHPRSRAGTRLCNAFRMGSRSFLLSYLRTLLSSEIFRMRNSALIKNTVQPRALRKATYQSLIPTDKR